MEVTSLKGHIVALNIQEPIPKKLGVEETLDRIHEAGGIAIACHPTAFFKGSIGKHVNERFDAIEVINASAFPFNYSVKHSLQFASKLKMPQVAGTDAHYGPQIGYAYTSVNADANADDVAKAICKGLSQPFGRAIPWTLRLRKEFAMLKRRISSSSGKQEADSPIR